MASCKLPSQLSASAKRRFRLRRTAILQSNLHSRSLIDFVNGTSCSANYFANTSFDFGSSSLVLPSVLASGVHLETCLELESGKVSTGLDAKSIDVGPCQNVAIEKAQQIAWHMRDLHLAIKTPILDTNDLEIEVSIRGSASNRIEGLIDRAAQRNESETHDGPFKEVTAAETLKSQVPQSSFRSLLEAMVSPVQDSLSDTSDTMCVLQSRVDEFHAKHVHAMASLHARLDNLSISPQQEESENETQSKKRIEQLIHDMLDVAQHAETSSDSSSVINARSIIQRLRSMLHDLGDGELFVKQGGCHALASWLHRTPEGHMLDLECRTFILQHLHMFPISLDALKNCPEPKLGEILKETMRDPHETRINRRAAASFIRSVILSSQQVSEISQPSS